MTSQCLLNPDEKRPSVSSGLSFLYRFADWGANRTQRHGARETRGTECRL